MARAHWQANNLPPLFKQAAPWVAGADPAQVAQVDAAKAEALRLAATATMLGIGAGGGLAAAMGLKNWLAKPSIPQGDITYSPQELDIPYPKRKKRADWADNLVRRAIPTSGDTPPIFWPAWLRGDTQTTPSSMPWALPLTAAGVVGGALGSHELVKRLVRSRQKAETQSDTDAAQREYNRALAGMYDRNKKAASVQDLYTLWQHTKTATSRPFVASDLNVMGVSVPSFQQAAGWGTGAYATLAAALAGGAGLGVYKWMRSRSPAKNLQEALKNRSRYLAAQQPPELHLRPVEEED